MLFQNCPNHGTSITIKGIASLEAVNHDLNPNFTTYKLCGHGKVIECLFIFLICNLEVIKLTKRGHVKIESVNVYKARP